MFLTFDKTVLLPEHKFCFDRMFSRFATLISYPVDPFFRGSVPAEEGAIHFSTRPGKPQCEISTQAKVGAILLLCFQKNCCVVFQAEKPNTFVASH